MDRMLPCVDAILDSGPCGEYVRRRLKNGSTGMRKLLMILALLVGLGSMAGCGSRRGSAEVYSKQNHYENVGEMPKGQ